MLIPGHSLPRLVAACSLWLPSSPSLSSAADANANWVKGIVLLHASGLCLRVPVTRDTDPGVACILSIPGGSQALWIQHPQHQPTQRSQVRQLCPKSRCQEALNEECRSHWALPFSDAMPRPAWPRDLASGHCGNTRANSWTEMSLNPRFASHSPCGLGQRFVPSEP